jgi:MFS transporter, DHA1 family, tetracycline resistance protein
MNSKKILWTLLLLVFIDMVGVGIIIPVLPELFFENTFFAPGTSQAVRGILLGLVIAAYPLAQFFGAPILGALSDKHGRRNLFILSIAGTAIGYVLIALSIVYGQLWLLFASRILDGFTGGNISIARSAIADISAPQERTRNFGFIGLAFGLGFILGPFLGGLLTNKSIAPWFGFATPFWFAALISAVNLLLIYWLFEETLQHPRLRKISLLTGMQDIVKGFSQKRLRGIYLSSFLIMFGWSFFTQFFQVFLYDRFSFNAQQIGILFAYIGVWIIITQGLLVRNIATSVAPAKVLRIATLGLIISTLTLLLPDRAAWLYACNALIAVFFGFILPNISSILSNAVSAAEQGEVLGIQQSMFSLAQGIPPLLAGASLAVWTGLPIVLAALFMLFGFFALPQAKSTPA